MSATARDENLHRKFARVSVGTGNRLRGAREIARGSMAYAAAPLLALALAPFLARSLGPEGRGQLSAVLQPLSVAEPLAALGVPAAVAVFVARGHGPRRVLSTAGLVVLPSLVVALGLLLLYAPLVADRQGLDTTTVVVAWCSVGVLVLAALVRGTVQGAAGFAVLDAEKVLAPVARAVLFTVLLVATVDVVGFYVAAHLLATVLGALVLLPRAKALVRSREGAGRPISRELTAFSVSAGVGSLAAVLNARADQALIPALLAPTQVGFYAVAVTIAELPTLASTVAARSLIVRVGSEGFNGHVRGLALLGVGLAVAGTSGVWLVAPFVVPALFGDEFAQAVPLVRVLAVGSAMSAVGGVAAALLVGFGRPLRGSAVHVVGAVLTVVLLLMARDMETAMTAAVISALVQGAVALTGLCLVARPWLDGRAHG